MEQIAHFYLENLVYMKTSLLLPAVFFCLCISLSLSGQTPATPTILEITEDDRAAVIFWNSKTTTYQYPYDPEKNLGVFSYLVEWGPVNAGFIHREVTPYRAFQAQPLVPGTVYEARVFALDSDGKKSAASNVMQFQHSDVKVNDMRSRLNGFFDDFNLPMGPFDEAKWNQAYSGCNRPGWNSQHINDEFHAHNVVATNGGCDRGTSNSRPRAIFDFTNRTGVIEFDMDGAKSSRLRWYIDISPANKKRDLSGHIGVNNSSLGDPAYMVRIMEKGHGVRIQLSDANGTLKELPIQFRNNACGDNLTRCPENLFPIPNVRRHWRIELSKTDLRIFIAGHLAIDASLITSDTPNGLPYEEAYLNWVLFSYNTGKENLPTAMIHWDNFGFDAPTGWTQNTVTHNYTDGVLGTETLNTADHKPSGKPSELDDPAIFNIPIPDPIVDLQGNMPLQTELMFTLQGSSYSWTSSDSITVNGHTYSFPKPTSDIPNFPDKQLIWGAKPYSVTLDIDPAHLNTGNNDIRFYLNRALLLNMHIELLFPKNQAPNFSQPIDIFSDHMQRLMEFRNHYETGPGLVISEIDGINFRTHSEFTGSSTSTGKRYVKQTPVSGIVDFELAGNSKAQLTSMAHSFGMEYMDILIDGQVFERVYLNEDSPIAAFQKIYQLNTTCLSNGVHDVFIYIYDSDGRSSVLDIFEKGHKSGEYIPIEITVNNPQNTPELDIQVLLEGAYDGSTMTTELNSKELLPKTQPFNRMPWNYAGTEQVNSFSPDIVDWVLVSLRTSVDRTTEVARFAALLLKDGQIVDVGGCAPSISVNTTTPLHVAIYHPSHLNVVSPIPIPFTNNQLSYDFRAENSYLAGSGQKEYAAGVWTMFAGNGDQNTILKSKDINSEDNVGWVVNNGLFNIYTEWDYNLDGDVNGLDKILWSYNNGVFTSVD